MNLQKVECPECEFELSIEEPVQGEVITCEDCGLNLEIKTVKENKVELELTDTFSEDWGE